MRKYVVSLPSAQLLVIPALSSINALRAQAEFPSLCDPPVFILNVLLNHEIFAAKGFLRVFSENLKVIDRSKPRR